MGTCYDAYVPRHKLPRAVSVCRDKHISKFDRLTCVDSARFFLGIAEGGLFPGVTFYLSMWYPRRMQAQRVSIFFSAATIAGAFGGILACVILVYLAQSTDGLAYIDLGLRKWRGKHCR